MEGKKRSNRELGEISQNRWPGGKGGRHRCAPNLTYAIQSSFRRQGDKELESKVGEEPWKGVGGNLEAEFTKERA